MTTILRDNLDPTHTKIGLATKSLIGLVYATVVDDRDLTLFNYELLSPQLHQNIEIMAGEI